MKSLHFYNSLTRRKESFKPLKEGEVRMYTCGPTVHDYAHIGNFRAYVFEDLLRRSFKFFGYRVIQVMNITDVDDKTIRKSQEQGISLQEYTQKYKEAFFEDLGALRIERAEHYPAATDHIPEMVDLIQRLIAKGHTYESEGSIYFRISSFPEYGRLSNIKADNLRCSLRTDADEYDKENARDFALWKAWTSADGDVFWETPLGKGRPGWHIECSAMSTKYLGTHFDIHTGGVDNKFPHHENEIAQSVCGYGDQFVNLWMHCAHLIVNGEKMSKSLGNFFTLKDLTATGISPRTVRYFLLSAHYRQPLNLIYDPETKTFASFAAAAAALDRIDEFRSRLADIKAQTAPDQALHPETQQWLDDTWIAFRNALAADLDISGALGAFFSLIKEGNRLLDHGALTASDAEAFDRRLREWDQVLGIVAPDAKSDVDASRIEALIAERNAARRDKNFARADEIRDQLAAEGIILQDTSAGTRWRKK